MIVYLIYKIDPATQGVVRVVGVYKSERIANMTLQKLNAEIGGRPGYYELFAEAVIDMPDGAT